ncbi:MAG: alpha/beta fold hydrolase [Gammaproteobacteria bacterium]|nr:alpha/beta fold hydrolase [Gammaproteobacteria bacterium]MCY4356121.1 alpha/beta fold hydrolase [Gammaproteobacteria bacterium]
MNATATPFMADPEEITQAEVDARVDQLIRRTIERNIPGLADLPQTESDLEVGPTPKELVYAQDTAQLFHYQSPVDEVYRVPILIIMSPVAKGYILDLAKGQSFVEYFLNRGHDVYMLDWRAPRANQSQLSLANYVQDLLGNCVNQVVEDAGEPDVTLVGYCMGGLLSLCYTALNSGGPVKNLACFTTPINSDGMTLHQRWVRSKSFDIDLLIDELGNIPSELINASMQALRPLQRNANQLSLLNNVQNDDFVKASMRFERWANDQIPLPGVMARDWTNDFLRDNLLVRNKLILGGKRVDFGGITVPFLHVAASFDHIIPEAASRDLINLVSSEDKDEIVVRGGHVSLVAGGNAMYRLWPKLDEWVSARSE